MDLTTASFPRRCERLDSVPSIAKFRGRISTMIRRESHWRSGIFAVNPAIIARHNPRVLLIGASHKLSQTAPLHLDALVVAIDRTLAPIHGHDQAHNADDHRPGLQHKGE
jgi:hypothetical protein